MADVTREEAEVMLHALGHLKTSKYRGRARKLASCQRNYFATDAGTAEGDGATWYELTKRGYAKATADPRPGAPGVVYRVTIDGFKALLTSLGRRACE